MIVRSVLTPHREVVARVRKSIAHGDESEQASRVGVFFLRIMAVRLVFFSLILATGQLQRNACLFFSPLVCTIHTSISEV